MRENGVGYFSRELSRRGGGATGSRAMSCNPRRARTGGVGRNWPAVVGGSVSGVGSAALWLRNGTTVSLSPRHDRPASVDSRCDCLGDQLTSLKNRMCRDRARWRTRHGSDVSARTRAVAEGCRPARSQPSAHDAYTRDPHSRDRARARYRNQLRALAFGRPIVMLMSPVPLASTCDVNMGPLRAERETGRVVSNPGSRAAS